MMHVQAQNVPSVEESRYQPTEKPFGRPTKYRPEFCQMIIEHFEIGLTKTLKKTFTTKNGTVIEEEIEKAAEFPMFEEFAHKIDVTCETMLQWCSIHPDFSESYARAKQLQKQFLVKNGIQGRFDGNFAKFVALNCTDMREKQEVVISGELTAPLLLLVAGEIGKPMIDVTPQAELSTNTEAIEPCK